MSRTRFTLGTGALALALAVAGCSGSPSDTDESGVVQLTFWHGYTEADGDVLESIVDDFNAAHDDINITTEVRTWDSIDDALLPALSAGDGPQLLAVQAERLPVYAARGALVPLDDYYANDPSAEHLNAGAVEMGVVDGVHYGVPSGFVPQALFYNKGLFEEAGITDAPTTWDELVDVARALTVDENDDGVPERYGIVLPDHSASGIWPALFYGNGGDIVSDGEAVIDSPENAETLQYWYDAIVEDQISPTGVSGIDADGLYSGQQAAMIIGGPWLATVSQENGIDYGIVPVPAGPVDQAASAIGLSLAVTETATDAQREAANAFFSYFYEEDVAIQWSLGSGWPPLRSDIEPAAVSENPVVEELTAQAELARPLLPGVVNSVDVLEAIDRVTQRALAGGDIAELLAEAQQSIADAVTD